MNTEMHLVQVGYFKPVLDTLHGTGSNIVPLLRKSSLNRFDLDNNENYVPVRCMYSLFSEIRKSEGIDDFFDVFEQQLELQNLCDWGESIAFTPDVLSAAQLAVKYDNVVQTHERMQLEINGPVSNISTRYLDQPQPGREYADYVNFCYLLSGLKLAGGAEWAPLEIRLQSSEAPDFEQLLPQNHQTRIYLDQPATSVVFPTSMLVSPMLGADSIRPELAIDALPQTLPQVIEKLLTSSQRAQIANLDVIADMLDLSPRTLRRRLNECETSFSQIVENWRFKSCLDLLEQDSTRVSEIAEQLGYANTPNFERAFKRWTGQSPGNYRDLL